MNKSHRLSSMQKHLLALYHDFKQFCEKNNIHYCAVGGTAIGTVRHNGFIPWDDDIDVGMPIADYERFLKLTSKLPKHLGYAEVEWMGGKVYDKRTTIIETQFLSRPERYFGAFIDIFPMVGTPNDDAEREKFNKDIHTFFLKAQFFTCYPQLCDFDCTRNCDHAAFRRNARDIDRRDGITVTAYSVVIGCSRVAVAANQICNMHLHQ